MNGPTVGGPATGGRTLRILRGDGRGAREPAGMVPDRRATRNFRLAMAVAVVATVAVRLGPLLTRHVLSGVLEYDDGVYYNAAAHLIAGVLPYRDFAFLQPPGIVLLLAPFAALAKVIGDPAAMVAARLGIVTVAAVNVVLLMRLSRRWSGPVAAVAAGAVYAAWGIAAAPERTVLLEPVLGLALLTALTLIGYPGGGRWNAPVSRVAAAGAVLGLGLGVKTWAVVDIAVLAGWLLWLSGRRAALSFTATALGAAAVVYLPFFIAAPRAMVHQVVADQLGRTQKLTPDPAVFGHDVAGIGQVYFPVGASRSAVILVLAAALVAVIVTLVRGPRIWAVLAIVQSALVLPQNSYTYHYIDFAAPALAACAGVAVAAAIDTARKLGRIAAALAGTAAATAVGLLAWQAVDQYVVVSPAPSPSISAFLKAHPCAFADYPALLPAAGAETAQVRDHCANLVDYTGAALAAGNGKMLIHYGHGWYRPAPWQQQVRTVMGGSDAAVLASWRPEYWTQPTQRFFHQRFRWAGRSGAFTLWVLHQPP